MDLRLWNIRNLLLVFLVFVAGMTIWHFVFSSLKQEG